MLIVVVDFVSMSTRGDDIGEGATRDPRGEEECAVTVCLSSFSIGTVGESPGPLPDISVGCSVGCGWFGFLWCGVVGDELA